MGPEKYVIATMLSFLAIFIGVTIYDIITTRRAKKTPGPPKGL